MNLQNNKLGPDDKIDPVMIYTYQRLIWGHLISKKAIKVSTWLQSDMAPQYLELANAQALLFGAGQSTANQKFPLLHIQKDQIIAYHLLPPSDESPYFDVNEPNRKMELVTIVTGIFRFDGALRMSEQSDIKMFLGAQKGLYLPVFDSTITCPLLPSIKAIQVPFALIAQPVTLISERK